MVIKKGKIFIGTSGWHYKHWIGRFYPEGTKEKDFLKFYDQHFSTVELNNPFYRMPSKETFENWRKQTPKNFLFSVKGSRYITHQKKLNETDGALQYLLDNVIGLEEKLGPILFQLPPGWNVNEERLANFLKILPKGLRFTFEFRNHTWYKEEVVQLLKKYKAAFCIYHLAGHTSPEYITSDFVYIRLHGPEEKYAGNYRLNKLKDWAEKIKSWSKEGKDVYCYFDNDQAAYATINAQKLLELI